VDTSLVPLALGAGLLAAVNPCGFALLPAYLSLLILGDDAPGRARAVGRALRLSVSMSLGFAAVFAVFGLAIAPFASSVQQHLPWVTLVLGVGLAAGGVLLLSGRPLALHLPAAVRGRVPRRRPRPARPPRATTLSMVGFGVGYALASLTCTAGPFLAVVVVAFRSGSTGTGLLLFATYALGMALVVGAAAVAVALARDGVVRRIRAAGRLVPRVSGVLLLLAGAYVAWYAGWELRVLAGSSPRDPVVDTAARVQRAVADAVGAVGPGGWAIVLVVLVLLAGTTARLRNRSRPDRGPHAVDTDTKPEVGSARR